MTTDLKTYGEHRPTGFDSHLPIRADDGDSRESWLVAPCSRNRDSDCAEESNWHTQAAALLKGENAELHRFGHWACGWYEIVIVRPGSPAQVEAEAIASRLEVYHLLDEDDLSERETAAADECWKHLRSAERIDYIRENRDEFELESFVELLRQARGSHGFRGHANNLIDS